MVLADNICIGCGANSKQGYTHVFCKKKMKQLPFQLLAFANFKDSIVRNIIHAFKYEGIKGYAKVCAALCARDLVGLDYDILTFVPLHHFKQNVREFNQAQLFAEELGKFNNTKAISILRKVRSTSAQMDLNREQRLQNVNGAFECISDVRNKNIILVDDVCTTGSTLRECSKVLLAAGANKVTCLVFARD